jgi:hypothetical protein
VRLDDLADEAGGTRLSGHATSRITARRSPCPGLVPTSPCSAPVWPRRGVCCARCWSRGSCSTRSAGARLAAVGGQRETPSPRSGRPLLIQIEFLTPKPLAGPGRARRHRPVSATSRHARSRGPRWPWATTLVAAHQHPRRIRAPVPGRASW